MMRRAQCTGVRFESSRNLQRFRDAFKHSLDSAFLEWQTTTRPEFDDSVYESPDWKFQNHSIWPNYRLYFIWTAGSVEECTTWEEEPSIDILILWYWYWRTRVTTRCSHHCGGVHTLGGGAQGSWLLTTPPRRRSTTDLVDRPTQLICISYIFILSIVFLMFMYWQHRQIQKDIAGQSATTDPELIQWESMKQMLLNPVLFKVFDKICLVIFITFLCNSNLMNMQ